MARHDLLLPVLSVVVLGCGPRGAAVLPILHRGAVFEGEKVVLELPDVFDTHAVGASGRFLIFHLKQLEQVAVLDVAKAKIVHTIPGVPEGVLLAAGADKLLVVRPGQRLIERWDFWTLRRERVAAVPTREPPQRAAMGCAGDGPLLLGAPSEAVLIDIETLRPLEIDQREVIGKTGRYGLVVDVSADGKTFTGIPRGIGPVPYTLMVVEPDGVRTGTFGGTSHAVRWARPSANGLLLFLPGGKIYEANLSTVAAKWLEGCACFPTPHPAFFLAVRFARGEERRKEITEARVCTTADRRVVHTIRGLEEMAPTGNTSSRYAIARRLGDHEPRFFYFPAAQALITLHYDNRRVSLRRLDLRAELQAAENGYVLVTSVPPAFAVKGERLEYQLEAASSTGGLTYKLEDGPRRAAISRKGRVTWRVPREPDAEFATLIIRVRDRAGRELFHTVHVRLVEPVESAR